MQKETAVEWLVNQYCKGNYFIEIAEQAKEMEKQQIMHAYVDSTSQFSVYSRIDYPKTAEQYYNETYKKK